MLRPISVIDVPSLLWLMANALPNPARTTATIGRTPSPTLSMASLMAEWLPGRSRRHTWVHPRRGVASGVVGLKRRSGRSSWEVECLFVNKRAPEAAVAMLEEAGVSVAFQGAERLLLRIPQTSPLELQARKAGFKPYYDETVFVRSPSASLSVTPASSSATENIFEQGSLAPYDLFRLHLRVVPPEAREPLELGFQQWLDSREGLCGRQASFIQRRDGDVSGWVSLVMSGKRGMVEILSMPGELDAARSLLAAALRQAGQRSRVVCVLPEYLAPLATVFEQAGFHRAEELTFLAKRMIAKVTQPEMVAVGA